MIGFLCVRRDVTTARGCGPLAHGWIASPFCPCPLPAVAFWLSLSNLAAIAPQPKGNDSVTGTYPM